MFRILFNGILNVVKSLLGVILSPINSLVVNLFPSSITTAIGNFTNFLTNYVGSGIGWFSYLLPPIFRSLVIIALTFMIGYYSFVWTYTAFIKIYNVIRRIKFW